MSAKDAIHDAVVNALVKDGWTITHDPYTIQYGDDDLFADMAAEKVIAADRGPDRIAVECKSFRSRSVLYDFERAGGQFLLYRGAMNRVNPDRRLVLAVSADAYEAIIGKATAVLFLTDHRVPVVVVSLETEEVVRWTS